jgi:hypothetical protein
LNSELTNGLIEVQTGTSRPDAGKNVIVGKSNSSYANKLFYSLPGNRVMKGHNDANNYGKPFTGTIETENPITLAYNSISNISI